MLFRLCLILLLSFVTPLTASAQDWATREVCTFDTAEIHEAAFVGRSEAELREAAAAIPNGLGRFWKVTSPEGTISHLWGSMHSTHPLILDLPEPVTNAISSARIVMPERSWFNLTRQEITQDFSFENYTRPDVGLFNIYHTNLDRNVISRMRTRMAALGYEPDSVNYFDYHTLIFTGLSDPCQDFYSAVLPVQDAHIEMRGVLAGAQIRGLETRNAVRHHLNNPLNEPTALAILETYGAAVQPQDSPIIAQTLAALYLAGEGGMFPLWEEDFLANTYGSEHASRILTLTNDYLVEARNYTFIETLIPELQDGNVFAYAGFLHLPGDTGMIELLRREGFTVERITLPGERP